MEKVERNQLFFCWGILCVCLAGLIGGSMSQVECTDLDLCEVN